MSPRVKICCIQNEAEAALAIECGASALGLVGAMPSGPGPIADDVIGRVAASVPPPIATFLLTSETTAAGIAAQHARCRTSVIQLCDHLAASIYAELRAALPATKLVQVVHVEGPESVDYALAAAAQVDALLLDSGRLSLDVRELGGTGRVHDWKLSRQIRDQADVPIFLAGGLRPENVRRAIAAVQPFGLDLCSGVRSDDRLDAVKLRAFMAAVRE